MFKVGDIVKVTNDTLLTAGQIGKVEALEWNRTNPVLVYFPEMNKTIGFGRGSRSLKVLVPKLELPPVAETPKQVFVKGDWVEATSRNGKTRTGQIVGQLDNGCFQVEVTNDWGQKHCNKFWADQLELTDEPVVMKTTVMSVPEGYVLWNPKSPLPPKVVHKTYEHAENAALGMSNRHKAQFYICKLVGVTTQEPDDEWQA